MSAMSAYDNGNHPTFPQQPFSLSPIGAAACLPPARDCRRVQLQSLNVRVSHEVRKRLVRRAVKVKRTGLENTPRLHDAAVNDLALVPASVRDTQDKQQQVSFEDTGSIASQHQRQALPLLLAGPYGWGTHSPTMKPLLALPTANPLYAAPAACWLS